MCFYFASQILEIQLHIIFCETFLPAADRHRHDPSLCFRGQGYFLAFLVIMLLKCQGRKEALLFTLVETKSLIVDKLDLLLQLRLSANFFHINLAFFFFFFILNTKFVTWK